jgi:uncharacterized membrane protein
VQVQNYGIGFIVIIAALILIGYFSSFFITGRIVSFLDKLLEKRQVSSIYILPPEISLKRLQETRKNSRIMFWPMWMTMMYGE